MNILVHPLALHLENKADDISSPLSTVLRILQHCSERGKGLDTAVMEAKILYRRKTFKKQGFVLFFFFFPMSSYKCLDI